MRGIVGYLIVAALGAFVGATEVASRYRDDPLRSVRQPWALVYVAVNAGGSVFALFAIRTFHWDFGFGATPGRELARVSFAGFGALALFRTRLFSAAIRGEQHTFGPGRLLEQLLAICDRQVDRAQAKHRSRTAAAVMANVSFTRAYGILPGYAISLLENADRKEGARLGRTVQRLRTDTSMDDRAKAQALGVAVGRFIGPELLRQAVASLGPSIRRTGVSDTPARRRSLRRRFSLFEVLFTSRPDQ